MVHAILCINQLPTRGDSTILVAKKRLLSLVPLAALANRLGIILSYP